MAPEPEMRAGDKDRDSTISQIREAYAEGRLTNDEFEQRMTQAQESKTYGELAKLVDDLPVAPVTPPPVNVAATTVAAPSTVAVPEEEDRDLRKGWMAWVGVSVMVNVIWAATWITSPGSPPYYWPIWVMGPWGAGMLIATLNNRNRD
jgi:hypothetical protein